MSILVRMTDQQLAEIAGAIRAWTDALARAGLQPMRHVTQDQANAVLSLMALCPVSPVVMDGDNGQPVDHHQD